MDSVLFFEVYAADPTDIEAEDYKNLHSSGFHELRGARGVDTFTVDSSTYAIVVSHSGGVQMINISDPANIVATDTETDGENGFTELRSAWGVDTFTIGSSTYAIVASNWDDGVQMINVTDPANIVAMDAETDGANGFTVLDGAKNVATFTIGSSTYAIVVSSTDGGVQMINVTDPANIVATDAETDGANGFTELAGAFGVDIFTIGSSTYAIVASVNDSGVQIIDISNPANIVAVDAETDGANGFTELDGAREVDTFTIGSSTYAIVASNWDDGVQMINVTDPANIVAMDAETDGANGFTVLDGPSFVDTFTVGSSTYAIVTAQADDGVQVIDVTDPANIVATDAETASNNGFSTWLNNPDSVDTFTIGSDTYAIVTASYYHGVQMIHLSSTSTPSPVGTIFTIPANIQVELSWSAPNNGGSSITDYIIQYSTDGTTWNTFADGTSTGTTATVTGLTNETLYYFKVAAVNFVGTGSYSDSVSVKTLLSNGGNIISEVDSLEHDTDIVRYNSLVQVDSDTYALAYSSTDEDGQISTFTISADGTSVTEVTTLEHTTTWARHNSLVQVDSDTYALAYSDNAGNGQITTFTISADGSTITEVASLEHDAGDGTHNSLVQVDSDTYVLAYTGSGYDGYISTFTISADGTSITEVASLEHDTSDARWNSIVKVDSNTYALAYTGENNNGYISTFTIPADGSTITEVASLNHDTILGRDNSLVQVDSDTYALAYMGSGYDGYISTFTISADGTSITEVASLNHDTSLGQSNSLVQVDSDTYVLAYDGQSRGDISTFTISADGSTITEVASLNHDTSGLYNSLVKMDSDTYALAYQGPGSDGYISTFTISSSTAPDAVGTVTPTAGDHQVTLSWSAPNNGGSSITDYLIQYSTDNSQWYTFNDGTRTGTTATLTGLNNGLQFYFKVAAVNSVGTGSYSSSTSATPIGAPSQVGTVTATPGTDTTALSWSAPSDNGSTINDYLIQYSTDNSTWNTFADGTSTGTTATVTGLTKGTTYYFKVAAVNAVGPGTYSASASGISNNYDANHKFSEKKSFDTGTRFQAGTEFKANQDFSGGAMTFGANQVFDEGTKFAASQGFTTAQTFGNSQEFGSGGTFASSNTWGEKADFSAGTQTFSAAQTFGAAAKFAANQDFTNVNHDFSSRGLVFSSGTQFSNGEVMGKHADFSNGTQNFGAGMTFGEATEFANSQDWGNNAQTFEKYMHFGKANDFAERIQTFKEGTSFGAGTTFKDAQKIPINTIPSFGIMLEAITCGDDTSDDTCIPNDASKYLAPGEFLAPGQDPAATTTSISANDKSFAVEGMGLEMTFANVGVDGTITSDLYDPANIPESTAVGSTGKVSVTTSNAGDVQTIGSVTNISTGTATISGDITITLSYSEANIPAGTAESDLTMIHYTGGQWITESNCTVDTVNNKISCTVTSLSPFGVGGSGSSGSSSSSTSSGGGNGGSCDSKGFGSGKSLMVHEVSFSEESNVVTLKAQSTCGTINSKVMTSTGSQIMKLSLEQPYLDDNIVVYSTTIDDTIDDFTIMINNKKNTFDKKYYPHGSDLIKIYTGDTGYTSHQQGTHQVSGYTSEQQGVVASTVTDTIADTITESVVEPVVESTPAYTPEPVTEETSEITKPTEPMIDDKPTVTELPTKSPQKSDNIQTISYTPEPVAQYTPEPVSTCGAGTELVNGFCKVIQKDDVQPWWQFW